MIRPELKKTYDDVTELFDRIQDSLPDIMSTKYINDIIRENGIEADQFFQPPDCCYNHTTKSFGPDEGFENSVHIFEYISRGKYRYLGLNYPYTGLVIRKRSSDGNELIVGEWFNGKLIKWDRNAQQDTFEYKDNYKQLAQEITEEIEELSIGPSTFLLCGKKFRTIAS